MASRAEPAPTAASILDRAVAGDEAAFARIVNAYHADLMRVAYIISGDQQTAEDAVQSAWSIAWRKLGSLRDPTRLRQWLVSVAANEARQLVRRQHRHTVVEIDVGRQADPAASPIGDPTDSIARIDLVNAMAHLKPDDRALLALRYVVDLDAAEIGRLLGMSPSGVRGHLSRLNERLRKELDDG
jgi:RNA polymerase sigma-70 factor (ECF subfamily)